MISKVTCPLGVEVTIEEGAVPTMDKKLVIRALPAAQPRTLSGSIIIESPEDESVHLEVPIFGVIQ